MISGPDGIATTLVTGTELIGGRRATVAGASVCFYYKVTIAMLYVQARRLALI